MRILAIDTATEGCSAALLIDQEIRAREIEEAERTHAERILPMIDELLADAGTSLAQLDAIAFGRGPGSFTGVRLAASVTQGLAFGSGLGVVPVSDLRAVAQRAVAEEVARAGPSRPLPAVRVLVCNDARMHEVYWGCFESKGGGLADAVGREHVGKPELVRVPEDWRSVIAAGRGFAAYLELRSALADRLSAVSDHLLPRAREIAQLAAAEARDGRICAPEEAIPVYLRDDVAQPQS